MLRNKILIISLFCFLLQKKKVLVNFKINAIIISKFVGVISFTRQFQLQCRYKVKNKKVTVKQ